MLKLSTKDSEHSDLYANLPQTVDKEIEEKQTVRKEKDSMYKFKKAVSLNTGYEMYLETEKSQLSYLARVAQAKDPMETVAWKIKRSLPLNLKDLKHWVAYNFLVFEEKDQETAKKLIERQTWFWRRMSVLIPPFWYFSYAVLRYQYKMSVIKNFFASSLFIGLLCEIGIYSSERDMKEAYSQMYDKYRDEVLLPKHRGLKLAHNKKLYQVDQKEFTSSNFDDLKQLLFKNKK